MSKHTSIFLIKEIYLDLLIQLMENQMSVGISINSSKLKFGIKSMSIAKLKQFSNSLSNLKENLIKKFNFEHTTVL